MSAKSRRTTLTHRAARVGKHTPFHAVSRSGRPVVK